MERINYAAAFGALTEMLRTLEPEVAADLADLFDRMANNPYSVSSEMSRRAYRACADDLAGRQTQTATPIRRAA